MAGEPSVGRHPVLGTNRSTPFARHRREDKGQRLTIDGLTIFGAPARWQSPPQRLLCSQACGVVSRWDLSQAPVVHPASVMPRLASNQWAIAKNSAVRRTTPTTRALVRFRFTKSRPGLSIWSRQEPSDLRSISSLVPGPLGLRPYGINYLKRCFQMGETVIVTCFHCGVDCRACCG